MEVATCKHTVAYKDSSFLRLQALGLAAATQSYKHILSHDASKPTTGQ